MELTVNGEKLKLEGGLTVNGLLEKQDVKSPDMVSVELNGRILRKSEFETTELNEGDNVEFLYFMGGGE